MKLREEILKEHSKAQCTKIVKWVGSNQQRFDELFDLFLNDEYRVVQRAAWPVSYPEIKPELKLIIEDQLPHQSAGFKSRAKMVLKQLSKLPGL